MIETLEAGEQKGAFRFDDGDAYGLAFALKNLTNPFLQLRLRHPERHPYPDNVEPVMALLRRGDGPGRSAA